MDENPYQSPEPPEEPIYFRERGQTWRGWRTIRVIGAGTFLLALVGAIVMWLVGQVTGFKPNWYVSLVFLVLFGSAVSLAILGRVGAYLHSIVLMFRDEYN